MLPFVGRRVQKHLVKVALQHRRGMLPTDLGLSLVFSPETRLLTFVETAAGATKLLF
jgi:hypothetical protein